MIDLDELMRLHEAATPGPWKKMLPKVLVAEDTKNPYGIPICTAINDDNVQASADAAYICAACNAVPELVERIKHLEAQLYEAVGYIISDESQSMIDCRICFFEQYCERKKDQWKPSLEMCRKAILSCVATDARKNDA